MDGDEEVIRKRWTREEELQRKLRERKQNRGQNSTDVQLRSASDVMSANKLIPTLQHRPSMIIRKDMIDNHHQALQKEQTAQQEEIARAEEELQRQLQQRQEKRANLSTKNVCAKASPRCSVPCVTLLLAITQTLQYCIQHYHIMSSNNYNIEKNYINLYA